MRVPHTIPVNTLRAYAASDQTLMLMGERFRLIRSEDLTWDERVPLSLAYICIQTLADNFEKHKNVLPFLPVPDLDYLLEILPPDLPVELVAPIIDDGIYWKRRCEYRWPRLPLDITKHSDSWKIMYIEKYVQEFIHYQEPGYIDWDEVSKVMVVCSPFVNHLVINELKPPRNMLPEPIPPDECSRGECSRGECIPDHMDLSSVLKSLVNLQEISIKFGVLNIGMKYNPNFFKVSLNDINNLSKGLLDCNCLTVFRLHRCNIDNVRVNIILNTLLTKTTLEVLEISHCKVGDIGAKAMGNFLLKHQNLKSLLILNNYIECDGVAGLAYALQNPDCCPLNTLDLQFNLIEDIGGECIATAIVKNNYLQEINLSGTGLTARSAKKIGDSLLFSKSMRKMILCNNHLDDSCADSFISAAEHNKKLYTLDLRNCGLSADTETAIHTYISRNRQIYRST
ncbi:dynein regulatory complex subunit 5 isoform X1 [Lycorma delicatula]|uniref:dynein regulatory complex subunit 5 isoform X1 n=1 Tax=Lycorma delicatula TaxID=130591 RepID=UPI003F511076